MNRTEAEGSRGSRRSRHILSLMPLMLIWPGLVWAAPPVLSESDISWVQNGSNVEFLLTFRNPDSVPSDPVNGALNSQEFGAFLENFGLICNFDVPAIQPGGSHDIQCTVPLSSLPPSAEMLLPASKASPGGNDEIKAACTVPNWFGNVDVLFGAGPAVNAHLAGNVPVCPGAGPTYVHVIVDNCTSGATWSFANVCLGWNVSLVSDVGGLPGPPAPNPLPPNPPPFDGWICVSAAASVPLGSVCCFTLNFNCAGVPATLTLWVEACDWSTVAVESATWSRIKALYGAN